jgi:hypothetical protein
MVLCDTSVLPLLSFSLSLQNRHDRHVDEGGQVKKSPKRRETIEKG